MLTSEQEIEELLDRYNQEAKEQGQRLGRLFYLLKGRKGYRKVIFNGDQWTNCWESPEGTDRATHIKRLDRSIIDIVTGDD